ncbi:PAS domain-containing two-component system sensor histidine kinase/response regulator [Burkholderia lata]|uniref:histidine kinase n=2 Tax=Burkholderia lata (strain ATCC 17760 / DSM 23089 / LMG 22485 / NCIMB 9086 / R18194 / 383) TaxID=482957 RepID=A0A6P2UYE4_BURL3|nr:PAS domain-containing two-component system sensor histidine kinase/response regulator [Burkholderia lata]
MGPISWQGWSLVRKGVVVIGISVLMLVGSLVTGYRLERQTGTATAEMLRTMKVQSDIQMLLTLIEDAATGVRGFVLTGQNDFLIPYRNARRQLPQTLDALRANVRDPEQLARLQRVIPLVELKLGSLNELSESRGTGPEDLREHLLASKEVLDQLRSEIRAMNVREAVLVEVRTSAVDEAIRRNALMNAATALVGLAGGAAMLIFTVRMVRRVRRAADNAERLALELPLLPGDSTTDELGQLSERLERASAVLATRAAAAQAANRAKTEFLSRTSHELRTPLNAILGFAQLLERDLTSLQQQQQASHIVRAGRHLLALIDDVLDIARIESGGLPIEPESVDVQGLLSEAIALVSPLADRRRIAMHGVSVDESLAILADRQRASQVVLNLLSNAIKYNQDGGWVRIDVSDDEQVVNIDVVDGGPGIPAELQTRLFTPFDRLGAERHNRDGIGLGLALSKSLMQQMGGQIDVDAKPGRGSTFRLTFPRAPLFHSKQMGVASPLHGATPGVKPIERTVLCVEDDPSNLALVETLMVRRPHLKLVTAQDGNEALRIVRETPPDLILLDLDLPGQSGEAVLRTIRTSPALAAIPVVILSADALQESVERLRVAGATSYLTKPLDLAAFYAALDETLT